MRALFSGHVSVASQRKFPHVPFGFPFFMTFVIHARLTPIDRARPARVEYFPLLSSVHILEQALEAGSIHLSEGFTRSDFWRVSKLGNLVGSMRICLAPFRLLAKNMGTSSERLTESRR